MEDSYKDVLQGISSSCCHDMMECFGARERHYNAGDVDLRIQPAFHSGGHPEKAAALL